MDAWASEWMAVWVSGWMAIWVSGWMAEWVSGRMEVVEVELRGTSVYLSGTGRGAFELQNRLSEDSSRKAKDQLLAVRAPDRLHL